jgi:hypothetical protein
MTTRKTTGRKPKAKPARTARGRGRGKASSPKGYTSAAWERVYLLSLELAAFARDLGLPDQAPEADGFDLADAAREAGRLALNHSRAATPDERTAAQEKDDWIAIGGLGADLGNMADEGAVGQAVDGVREVAYELCYLACDYLF